MQEESNVFGELGQAIQIKNTPPLKELYDKVKKAFGEKVDFDNGTVFTYGMTIYSKNYPDPALIEHEKTHVIQQMTFAGGPDAWWDKYLSSPEFRMSQEVDAYKIQYRAACLTSKDRNALFKYAHRLAIVLSSSMYGNMLSTQEALKLITKK